MPVFGLEAQSSLSWEHRLSTIGRMLDQRGPLFSTMHITVLDDGLIVQRPDVVNAAAQTLGPTPAYFNQEQFLSRPESQPIALTDLDDSFVVKRTRSVPPPSTSTLPLDLRQRLRHLMRAANAQHSR